MKKTYRSTAIALAFALVATAVAGAAPQDRSSAAWRCGNTYTDQACAGGTPVRTDDARSADARRAADEATRRSERAADAMERDRLRLERAAAMRGGATVFADHRVGEARERAARRASEAAARQRLDKANKPSGPGKAGKKRSANGDFVAQAEAPAGTAASAARKKRGAVN